MRRGEGRGGGAWRRCGVACCVRWDALACRASHSPKKEPSRETRSPSVMSPAVEPAIDEPGEDAAALLLVCCALVPPVSSVSTTGWNGELGRFEGSGALLRPSLSGCGAVVARATPWGGSAGTGLVCCVASPAPEGGGVEALASSSAAASAAGASSLDLVLLRWRLTERLPGADWVWPACLKAIWSGAGTWEKAPSGSAVMAAPLVSRASSSRHSMSSRQATSSRVTSRDPDRDAGMGGLLTARFLGTTRAYDTAFAWSSRSVRDPRRAPCLILPNTSLTPEPLCSRFAAKRLDRCVSSSSAPSALAPSLGCSSSVADADMAAAGRSRIIAVTMWRRHDHQHGHGARGVEAPGGRY